MSRDTRDDRPPLRASELLPGLMMLFPGEVRAVVCPGCGRWQVPYHGRFRRHGGCPEAGRRVWFDLTSAQWLARLQAAAREAAARRGSRVRGTASPPVPPPLHRTPPGQGGGRAGEPRARG